MQMNSIIFDLDGTLWDTCDTCAVAWNNVISSLGLFFRKVTGKPHEECIRETFVGLPENQILAIAKLDILRHFCVIPNLESILRTLNAGAIQVEQRLKI